MPNRRIVQQGMNIPVEVTKHNGQVIKRRGRFCFTVSCCNSTLLTVEDGCVDSWQEEELHMKCPECGEITAIEPNQNPGLGLAVKLAPNRPVKSKINGPPWRGSKHPFVNIGKNSP